jgi:hypothetical protein
MSDKESVLVIKNFLPTTRNLSLLSKLTVASISIFPSGGTNFPAKVFFWALEFKEICAEMDKVDVK